MSATLTIGITTFNARHTALKAIESALSQSHPPDEIIIVDDASTDGTQEVLNQAINEVSNNIKLICLPDNQGVAVARNRIIEEAQGEFLAFFDDDDISHPERCAQQISRISQYESSLKKKAKENNNQVVICHTAREQHYPDGIVRIEHTMGEAKQQDPPNGIAVAMRILRGDPLKNAYGSLATCSQMARVETYHTLGGFDPALRRGEDTEFNIRLARKGGHFVGIATPLVTQTMMATSDKPIAAELNYAFYILDKHRDLFQSEVEYRFCRSWLDVKDSWMRRSYLEFTLRLTKLCLVHPLHTFHRIRMALPNIAGTRAVSKLHKSNL